MRLKRRKRNHYFWVIILIIFFTNYILKNIGDKLSYHIENIVVKNVDKSVYSNIFVIFGSEDLGNEELLNVINLNMNSDEEIVSVDYKMDIAYKYLSKSMNTLYDKITSMNMDSLYKSGINNVYYLPMGLIYNNVVLDHLGFKIPCKIDFISDIDMGFKTKVSNYGVNNLLIELYMIIDVKNHIMSPSTYKEFGNTYEILVASKIIVGKIPVYYGDVIEKTSSIVSS